MHTIIANIVMMISI